MLSASNDVTALVPKQQRLIAVACGLIATLLLVSGVLVWHSQNHCKLKLEQTCLSLEYATTPQQQVLGLGGRNNLPTDHAMLFVIGRTGPTCFWMKDMRFNLDIIWLDSSKRVTMIKNDLSPSTYPQQYCSPEPAAFVLEAVAGTAAKNHLVTGQPLNF